MGHASGRLGGARGPLTLRMCALLLLLCGLAALPGVRGASIDPGAPTAVGPAAAPSPQEPTHARRVLVLNCGGLGAHWDTIAEMQWDVLLCQEAHLERAGQVRRTCRERGWQLFQGPADSRGAVLVCTIVRIGAASMCDAVSADPRAITVRWYAGGNCTWRLTNIYGDVAETEAATSHTSALVREAVAQAEGRRGIPALVVGDLNRELPQFACGYALACSGWEDLSDEPTSSMAAAPRRIDLLLANPEMRRRVSSVTCDWSQVWRPHATQCVILEGGPIPREPLWVPPPSLGAVSESAPDPEAAWDMACVAEGLTRDEDRHCVGQGTWAPLRRVLLRYHSLRAGAPQDRRPGRVSWDVPEPVAKGTEEAHVAASRAAQATFRRLSNICLQLQARGSADAEVERAIAKLRRATPAGDARADAFAGARSLADWLELKELARADVQAAAKEGARVRTHAWKSWCNTQLSEAGSGLYAWVRNGPRPRALPSAAEWQCSTRPDGVGPPSRYQDLVELERYWFGLWNPLPAGTPGAGECRPPPRICRPGFAKPIARAPTHGPVAAAHGLRPCQGRQVRPRTQGGRC